MKTLIVITAFNIPETQALRYKAGDRVQLINPNQEDIERGFNGVGTILEALPDSAFDYWIKWHPHEVKSIVFDEELERAEE